jgi:hypothetical protein
MESAFRIQILLIFVKSFLLENIIRNFLCTMIAAHLNYYNRPHRMKPFSGLINSHFLRTRSISLGFSPKPHLYSKAQKGPIRNITISQGHTVTLLLVEPLTGCYRLLRHRTIDRCNWNCSCTNEEVHFYFV